MAHWPEAKQQRSMGHYARADLSCELLIAGPPARPKGSLVPLQRNSRLVFVPVWIAQ
jgi:hypothetical protein